MSPSGALGLSPEQQARAEIDRLLTAAGWDVCDSKQANIHASRGVANLEFHARRRLWLRRLHAVCRCQGRRSHRSKAARCDAFRRRDAVLQMLEGPAALIPAGAQWPVR